MLHAVCSNYGEASSWARGYGEALHELVTWLEDDDAEKAAKKR